jgi:5-methylcytosine-specific restriction enzyme subunit McrC
MPDVSTQFTEYGIPIRNLWHMLLYAWNEYPVNGHWMLASVENGPTLDALLATILAKLVEQRLRIGLGRSYINEAQTIHGIRGRVDFTASLKYDMFERGQAHCRFQHYSANAPKNQIIRATLMRLAQVGDFGYDQASADKLRHHLRGLTRALEGISLIELTPDLIRRQATVRDDGDYRLMLAICELILQRQMPMETSGGHYLPGIQRQALVLYNVYERFVANFYRLRLQGYTVKAQSRLAWHARQDIPYLPVMKPDLILQSSNALFVMDTKFTANSLVENRWGKQLFDSSHLYQMYAYLTTQRHLSTQHQKAIGILLYPTVTQKLSERIELGDHIIRIECVDLSAAWQDVEEQLLGIISEKMAGG